MDRASLTAAVKLEAARLGFELVGVTTPDPPPHLDAYRGWIEAGRHASMSYLAAERAVARRSDPRSILPGCRSILVVGLRHSLPPAPPRPAARVAGYALGADYHDLIPARLQALMAFLRNQTLEPFEFRIYTDTGPILERDLAQRAGLGWIGRNTCLIHPRHGSYFLLGEVFLTLDLTPDPPFTTDHCGSCTRCLEACPTDCILPDRTLDAARCISYQTIENRGPIPEALRPAIGEWLFGCDICQQVCPWNLRFAGPTSDPDLKPRPWLDPPEPDVFLDPIDAPPLKGTALSRARSTGMARNAAVVLGNLGAAESAARLAQGLRHPEGLVRRHSAWGLAELGGDDADRSLRAGLETESDPEVRDEIARALRRVRGGEANPFPPGD
jgi:epoxyqueuosine reductase